MILEDMPENVVKVAALLFVAGARRENLMELLLATQYKIIAELVGIEPVDVGAALLWLRDVFADAAAARRRELN
jgi:hypothetical protein